MELRRNWMIIITDCLPILSGIHLGNFDQFRKVADPPLETFEVPDDIFDKKPFCLRYEKEDDSCIHDGSVGEDSDYDEPTKEYLASDVSPFKVTGIIHCCAPIGVIKNNVRLIIPTCNPLINTCNGGGRN